MTTPFKLLLGIALWHSATTGVRAQVITITQGTASTCSGMLVDSGGEGGDGYANDEEVTLVLCPDAPGTAVTLEWLQFVLSTQGTGTLDHLSVYDGTDTSAPLLGAWQGGQDPGTISATVANASGCLTVHFVSNEVGTGSFFAEISCAVPCEPPTPLVVVNNVSGPPYLICQNAVLDLDASASFAAPGFNIVDHAWSFGDGTVDNASGAVVQHAYSHAGAYDVQLVLTDDNGCSSAPLTLLVRVSTTPHFVISPPEETTICLGEGVQLNATGTAADPWEAATMIRYDQLAALPDGSLIAYDIPVQSQAQAGSVITGVEQIGALCVEIEHSYMGDLIIALRCPNGQEMLLHDGTGDNTFLGDPYDMDDALQGECWAYCWSPQATTGTWEENSFNGATPNVMPGGQDVDGNSLIPGTYEAVGSFNDLVGCPVVGEWTLRITDDALVDNGYLCSWSFDLFAGTSQAGFTPVLQPGNWSGAGVIPEPLSPFVATATPPQEGVYDYTYAVSDDFGCTYDTTVTIDVIDPVITTIDGPTVPPANGAEVEYSVATTLGNSIHWLLPDGWAWADEDDTTGTTVALIPPTTVGTYVLCASVSEAGCTGDPFCLSIGVGGTIGMDEAAALSDIRVFPVPTAGEVRIDRAAHGSALLTVVDVYGRLVHATTVTDRRAVIDLGALSDGAYQLIIATAEGRAVKTIVVQH